MSISAQEAPRIPRFRGLNPKVSSETTPKTGRQRYVFYVFYPKNKFQGERDSANLLAAAAGVFRHDENFRENKKGHIWISDKRSGGRKISARWHGEYVNNFPSVEYDNYFVGDQEYAFERDDEVDRTFKKKTTTKSKKSKTKSKRSTRKSSKRSKKSKSYVDESLTSSSE